MAAGSKLELGVAQRYAIWIPQIPPGNHLITGDFHHWITNQRHPDGTAIARIAAA